MLHTEYQTGPDRNIDFLVSVSKFPPPNSKSAHQGDVPKSLPVESRHLCQGFVGCKEKHPALRPRREGQKFVGWEEAWMGASFKALNA